MKTTLVYLLILYTIRVHAQCPDIRIDESLQDKCNGTAECKSKFGGTGICFWENCCPDPTLENAFQTNTKCDESRPPDYYYSFCKNGYVHTVGQKQLKTAHQNNTNCFLNSQCPGENSYCVIMTKHGDIRKCFVIESWEAKKLEKENEKKEEDNKMMMIIIVVGVGVVAIVIIGIVVGCLVCKKMKKGKVNHGDSAENSRGDSQTEKIKGKTSKEKMKKGKKGFDV
ncbi:unnamed protein product [Caenorhabditis angaria]|uniref:Domain of unknown function DX domain-containing protein n=1 Tax=Caenorhabditis angaria TaxID=860376 RepID=A0A9P1IMK7_9PELO|nr:unnamed protein product [Caenorhabditis angaria]